MGIRRVSSKFVMQGKELLKRLRSTEKKALTPIEMHALRLHIHLLDIEIQQQYTNTASLPSRTGHLALKSLCKAYVMAPSFNERRRDGPHIAASWSMFLRE